MEEYIRCLDDVKVAENQFNNASEEFLDCAIHNYNSVLARRRALLMLARKNKM